MSEIQQFMEKVFAAFRSGIILPLGLIAHSLVKCAKSHTYVETLGSHSDSLHKWIAISYEEDFKRVFQNQVIKALKRLGVHTAKLAIDITKEPFYGEYRNLYLINIDNEKWGAEFHFAVVYLIVQNKTIPLMAIPVRIGEGVARPTIELLEYCQAILKSVQYVLFDRGFYCAELIDYLSAKKIRYCMLCPEKKGSISGYVAQTREFGQYPHIMEYNKKKSTWRIKTNIVVCKGVDEWSWIFATNMRRLGRIEIILLYKKRWRIETGFRVQDEARIKSKSTNILIRYFYFLIGCLLQLLWVVHKHYFGNIQFKRYLDQIEGLLFLNYLGIRKFD
jgi:hypothetical protein